MPSNGLAAAREADPRGSSGISGQCACDRQPDRDARGPLEELAPAVRRGLRLGVGRQRFLAAFTQIVHSNLLLHRIGPMPGPERISEPHLLAGEASGAILRTCMQRFQLRSAMLIGYKPAFLARIRDLSDAPLADLLGLSRAGRGRHRRRARNRPRLLRPARRGRRDSRRRRHRRGGGREAAAAIGPRASAAAVDVREAASVRALVERRARRARRLDVWVNAAGVYPTSPLLELSERGLGARARHQPPRDVPRRARGGAGDDRGRQGGVIVNVSSTAAYRAEAPGAAHYVASKFGVRGLTQALAVELGPHGIRVLEVAPTVTLTPGLEAQRSSLESAGFALEELGPTPAARPRRGARRRRPRRPLLRVRPLAADDGQHAARRRGRARLGAFARPVAVGVGEHVDADVAGRDHGAVGDRVRHVVGVAAAGRSSSRRRS